MSNPPKDNSRLFVCRPVKSNKIERFEVAGQTLAPASQYSYANTVASAISSIFSSPVSNIASSPVVNNPMVAKLSSAANDIYSKDIMITNQNPKYAFMMNNRGIEINPNPNGIATTISHPAFPRNLNVNLNYLPDGLGGTFNDNTNPPINYSLTNKNGILGANINSVVNNTQENVDFICKPSNSSSLALTGNNSVALALNINGQITGLQCGMSKSSNALTTQPAPKQTLPPTAPKQTLPPTAANQILLYNNYKRYNAGDNVIFNGRIYRFNAFIGAAGYGPTTHPTAWTQI